MPRSRPPWPWPRRSWRRRLSLPSSSPCPSRSTPAPPRTGRRRTDGREVSDAGPVRHLRQLVAARPPRTALIRAKLDACESAFPPDEGAVMQLAFADDPEPEAARQDPFRRDLQLCACRRDLADDALSVADLAGHDDPGLHIGFETGLVFSFFSGCCHAFDPQVNTTRLKPIWL